MMAGWHRTPAVVLGRCLTALAHNALGRALFAGHAYSGDLARLVFLDPDAREFSPDWEQVAATTVGGLRSAAGTDTDDPQLVRTVGELSLKSAELRHLWDRHDIRQETHEAKCFRHSGGAGGSATATATGIPLAVTLTGGNRNDGLSHPRMPSHLLATPQRVAGVADQVYDVGYPPPPSANDQMRTSFVVGDRIALEATQLPFLEDHFVRALLWLVEKGRY
ncbi:hypothetical protein [Streptomyces noursei]|uniref:MmyB family transcriptional regulator n=1 Tax=Streptomyces noursei TaxID=1971 RepID=UPI0030F35484